MSRIETGAANPTLTMIWALAVSLEVAITDLFVAELDASSAMTKTRARVARHSRGRVSR